MGEDEAAQFMSIEALLASCGSPRPCQAALACEGRIVRVRGYVDYDNIFDRDHYPQLPYEKFTIRDRGGNSIEVWAVARENREVFREIMRHRPFPEQMAYVEGELVGFDMPTMGRCQRGLRINLAEAGKLFFR